MTDLKTWPSGRKRKGRHERQVFGQSRGRASVRGSAFDHSDVGDVIDSPLVQIGEHFTPFSIGSIAIDVSGIDPSRQQHFDAFLCMTSAREETDSRASFGESLPVLNKITSKVRHGSCNAGLGVFISLTNQLRQITLRALEISERRQVSVIDEPLRVRATDDLPEDLIQFFVLWSRRQPKHESLLQIFPLPFRVMRTEERTQSRDVTVAFVVNDQIESVTCVILALDVPAFDGVDRRHMHGLREVRFTARHDDSVRQDR